MSAENRLSYQEIGYHQSQLDSAISNLCRETNLPLIKAEVVPQLVVGGYCASAQYIEEADRSILNIGTEFTNGLGDIYAHETSHLLSGKYSKAYSEFCDRRRQLEKEEDVFTLADIHNTVAVAITAEIIAGYVGKRGCNQFIEMSQDEWQVIRKSTNYLLNLSVNTIFLRFLFYNDKALYQAYKWGESLGYNFAVLLHRSMASFNVRGLIGLNHTEVKDMLKTMVSNITTVDDVPGHLANGIQQLSSYKNPELLSLSQIEERRRRLNTPVW